MVYQLPSSFSGGIQSAVESIKKWTLPQSVTSPVVKPEKVKQTTKLPVKKTGYVPLTREQFMKAQESGFTPDQIIEMEKRRKSEMESVPQSPKFDRSNPQQFLADYEQSVREGNPRALATWIFSWITKWIGNIAQFVEKTPTVGEMIFGKKETGLPSIAEPIQKRTNMVADTATSKLWVNPESNFYKWGEFAGKIALTNALLPWIWGGAGLGSRVLAWVTEWALQGWAFDVVNQGKVTKENVGIWAVVWGALPLVWATLSKGKEYFTSKLPAKLQLQGLMNPAKVTMLKKQLQTDWVATPEDVAKWMIDRNIKGDKETIIKTLISRAEQSKQAVDDSLAAVYGTVQSNIAKNALQQSYDDVSKIAGLEDEASRILELLNKDTYTLSELNQVKRILDDQYNLFTKTGDPTAWLKAKWLQGIRQQLRQTIEDVASKAGIKNIKALNNETQIARWMADAIARKDSADAVREALTAFAPTWVGGIIGWVAWPFDNNTVEGKVGNILLGMFVGRVAGSTKLKTNVASFLSKLSKKEVSALDAYLKAGGKSALPLQILEKLDDTIKLLPPASGLPTSAKVVDVQPMTGFLPWVMQKQSEAISSKVWTQPLTTSLSKGLSKSAINSEASTVLPKQTTKVNIPWKKVNTPIIQKTEVKAKLPMKETPKTPQNNTEVGIIERSSKKINSLMDELWDKAKMADWTSNELEKALNEGKITLDEAKKIHELRIQKWMSNNAFEKMNNTGTKSELKGEPSWQATIRNFEEKAKTPQVEGKTEPLSFKDMPKSPEVGRYVWATRKTKDGYVAEIYDTKTKKTESVGVWRSKEQADEMIGQTIQDKGMSKVWDKVEKERKQSLPLSSKSEVKYSKPIDLSDAESDLIFDYTKSGGGTSKPMWIEKQKKVSNVIKKLPENTDTVYSWQKPSNETISELESWEFTSKRLISSSTEKRIAQEFMDYNPNQRNQAFFTIEWGGHDISKFSQFNHSIGGEKEILFPIGTKFKVEKTGSNTYTLYPQ